jgi:hypothetical protein
VNRIDSIILLVAVALIVLGIIGGLNELGASRRMTCTYTTMINGEAKTKNTWCIQRPHVRQDKPATAEPTETATPEYPTATIDEWQPWSTATPGATIEPYPPEETGEPYP